MNRVCTHWLRAERSAIILAVAFFAMGADHAQTSSHGSKGTARDKPAEASASGVRGIELGEFNIRSDYPAEAEKSTVRFVLYAAVKAERLTATDRLVEQHRQKLRDEVITATRLTPLGVFEEPDLKTFRRRILIRLHRTVPEFVVEDLYVSDFGLKVKSF
jgi:hypothetical protein